MGKVTVYLDGEGEKKARAAARTARMSLSHSVTQRIRRGAPADWPKSVRELAGAWTDLPSAEQLRRRQGRDSSRGR